MFFANKKYNLKLTISQDDEADALGILTSYIEKGNESKDNFLELMFDFTRKSVQTIKDSPDIIINTHQSAAEGSGKLESLGVCPTCGSPVIEGTKGYGCSNWRSGCKFVIWKDDKYLNAFGKKPNKPMVKKLLKDGCVELKDLKSKSGKTFNAIFRYEKNTRNNNVNYIRNRINNSSNIN